MEKVIITNMLKLNPLHGGGHPGYAYEKYPVTNPDSKYEVSGAFHGNQCVAAFYTIPPGMANYPYHYHMANEEVFYIISGEAILETEDGERSVSSGDIIVCPAGESGAHRLRNPSAENDLVYLDIDTNNTPDVAFYPRSGKLGVRAPGGIRGNYKTDSAVEYYDGEN